MFEIRPFLGGRNLLPKGFVVIHTPTGLGIYADGQIGGMGEKDAITLCEWLNEATKGINPSTDTSDCVNALRIHPQSTLRWSDNTRMRLKIRKT